MHLSSETLFNVRTFIFQIKILIFARKKNFAEFINEILNFELFQLLYVAYLQQLQT